MSNSQNPMVGLHGFLIMGMDKLFLSHLPMFSTPKHAFQMILEVDLPEKDVGIYKKTKDENPDKPLIIVVREKVFGNLSNSESFESKLCFANEDGDQSVALDWVYCCPC